MINKELEHTREKRARVKLELDIWDVIDKHINLPERKCEAKVTLRTALFVLHSIISKLIERIYVSK